MSSRLIPKPSLADCHSLADRGNLIPVSIELLADQLTPVTAYQALRRSALQRNEPPRIFLLESVEGGQHEARYSFIALDPEIMVSSRDGRVKIEHRNGAEEIHEDSDPIEILKTLMSEYQPVTDESLPRFTGGAVGYLGYDAVQYFERIPLRDQEAGLDWPDLMFGITRKVVVFDHVKQSLTLVVNLHCTGDLEEGYRTVCEELQQIADDLSLPTQLTLTPAQVEDVPEVPVHSNMTPDTFKECVRKAKEYIRAGDIIQTVLSQRFEADADIDPLAVYRVIRSLNPSPYMFNLEFGDRCLVGASPEIHVRCEDGIAEVRPIAGTRPRGRNEAEDKALADELLADPKERAEHLMLVDLGRNDLGRVCDYGSVHVPELMVVERYSHVMHIVSDVQGKMKGDCDAFDLMRATFPAGTLSGAPKIRAMEIIAELEPTRRGAYGGAVGYFGFDGTLDSCITIRTLLLDGRKAYVQAGAGIVADSDPDSEFEETKNKARSMLKALALAQHHARTEVSS